MKAVSIRQPWAWAIIHAGKDIENRKWNTHLRGTFAVHASGNLDNDAVLPEGVDVPDIKVLPRGAIIGVVDLVEVVEESSSKWFTGPYGFVLRNPRPLPRPIPCKGSLKFWQVPSEVIEELEVQLTKGSDKPSA